MDISYGLGAIIVPWGKDRDNHVHSIINMPFIVTTAGSCTELVSIPAIEVRSIIKEVSKPRSCMKEHFEYIIYCTFELDRVQRLQAEISASTWVSKTIL